MLQIFILIIEIPKVLNICSKIGFKKNLKNVKEIQIK